MRIPNLLRWLATGLTLIWWAGAARALDPNHPLSQYLREQWTTDSNFPGGAIDAITQTSDGYLWMGAAQGLVRFDGVNFRLTSSFLEFSGDPVSGLTTDGEGRLCAIFWGAGVLCHRDGKFVNLASIFRRTALHVISSWRKEDGALLLTDLINGILLVRGENVQVLAPPILFPPSLIRALAETRDGKIWLGTDAAGLFYFADGRTTRAKGVSDKKINCLLPIGDRELWVGTSKGLYRWNGSFLSRVKLPQGLADVQVLALLRDHDGNVWAGTTRGLLRINASGVSVSDEGGFESGGINALFEDREGNLWAGGGRGLERIRDGTFVTYTPATGSPPSKQNGPVYVDSENRTWFAPARGGLYVMKDGQAQSLNSSFLHDEVVYSITGRKNEIWIGTQGSGLKRFGYRNEAAGKTYTQANGLAENSVFAVHQSQDGAVWAGTLTSGVSKFKDGKFVTYTTVDGLAANTISAILDTRDGTVWFATPNGLSALSRGHWTTYTTEDGLPSNGVNCLFEDAAGLLWIGTSRGLAFFKSGRIQVPRDTPDSLREEAVGMSEDKEGWLWIATSDHVLRVPNQKLSSGVLSSAEIREFEAADGLPNPKGVKRSKSVVADSKGRIWFSTSSGVSVVDPSHMMNHSIPALPHIEAITADNDPITVSELVRIPPSRKRITFRYTGLSLAVPERIRFRYSLDSFDRGWSEPTADREAVYTNLSPGSYRFRVIASNSYGQWTDSEAAVLLEVDPAYYQTIWFRSVCVAAFLALLGAIYRLRLRQVAQQFNMRLEERVSERTRIARELHDTLLQSFHGLLPRFQAVQNLLPGRIAEAQQVLEAAVNDAARAITEARDAVQDLRSSTTITNDLAKAIEVLGQELRAHQTSANGAATDFLVRIDGTSQHLHPMLRDEIYRITGEALRNAFHHARARRIEVEIEYDTQRLRTRVRDDGIGIDASILSQEGRPGHFGLRGMRERSRGIGGQLDVWSERGAGTEVELTIPASVAYRGHGGRRFRVFKSKPEKTS